MKYDEIMSKLFGFSVPTYYNWKRENRPIINLINKYFTSNDLLEFIDSGKISKYEFFSDVEVELIHEYTDLYFNFVEQPYYEKFYKDFLYRFKNDIIQLERLDIQNTFQSLLFEYQLILINISQQIGYPTINIIKDFYAFNSLFNTREPRFFVLFVNLVKHDFIHYNCFLRNDDLFETNYKELQETITSYEHKELVNIPLKTILNLNSHDYSPNKNDFFITYQNYLEKKALFEDNHES